MSRQQEIMEEVDQTTNHQVNQNHTNFNNSNVNSIIRPQQYNFRYDQLSETQRAHFYTPQQYSQWYYYQIHFNQQINLNLGGYRPMGNQNYYGNNIHQPPIQNNIKKQQKLSRNQKRKLKKKQLQQELKSEQKKMGKWVEVERKDLVDSLKKIEEKEQRIKQKRKQKLSHLIEIHKEVYKHMLKKNKGKPTHNRQKIGNFRVKKKKPSHIKRMKQIYQKYKKGQIPNTITITQTRVPPIKQQKIEQVQQKENDSDYVTQSQSQVQQQKKLNIKAEQKKASNQEKNNVKAQQKLITQKEDNKPIIKQVKTIQYKTIGKLNSYVYNSITLREWVDHVPSAKLQDLVLKFINRLAYKQAIKKVNQPQKARKLIIAGLHECRRTLWTKLEKKKSRLIIVALNIERNNLQRGTDDQLQQVLSYAHEQKVPAIHISTRAKLGRAFTGKFGPRITMISVINYEGYEDIMEMVLQQWKEMKKAYYNTDRYCFKF